MKSRTSLLLIALLSVAPGVALAQQWPFVLPPDTIMGNMVTSGPPRAAVAVTIQDFVARLNVSYGLLYTPAATVDGNAVVFGTTLAKGSQTLTTSIKDAGYPPMLAAPMPAWTLKGNATSLAAAPADIDITALPYKASPGINDVVLLQDVSAGNAYKRTTAGALGSPGSVSSIGGLTGAVGLGNGLATSSNNVAVNLTTASNFMSGDVAISSTGTWYDGPSMAQGSTGTWSVISTITFQSTAADLVYCKLWDGTNVIASGYTRLSNFGSAFGTITLGGNSVSGPPGNIRTSCRSDTATAIVMKFNLTGAGKDSGVSGHRIQ